MHEHVTIVASDPGEHRGRPASTGLPADLLDRSAGRLRSLALLYSVVFFLAAIFPALLFPNDRAQVFSRFLNWGPAAIGIVMGLVLAGMIRNPRVPLRRSMTVALVFEVVSSYAIAASEFGDGSALDHAGNSFFGLSWVAVWVVLFTVVVPTSPPRALAAALASVSAVPAVVGTVIATGGTTLELTWTKAFFGLVFPYLLVVAMAYVGARVVYHLGTEVRRARELGSYRLEEKLGQGGMGEVWRARHRLLARPAAIKLIRSARDGAGGDPAGGVSEEAVRRFEREAQVIAGLCSPHTVGLFDFGRADDGAFYYAMELLDGLDAESMVRRHGPMPPERVVHVLRQVCHSLSEAHASGLVHRDVKPANILLCRYGEEFDFVKVLDFGLVRELRAAAGVEPAVTRENTVHGTPAYIAPEQVMGGEVDGRADLYATGCVANWLLTGETVFTADSPMGLLVQHAQAAPVPPSARTELGVPRDLDALVMACLAKDPAERPQSARELSERLAALECADAWTQERARDWWRMHLPA